MAEPVVIVGDSMLDVDIEGSATRLSPEAPVPVVDAERVWHRPGGAGLAAVLAARVDRDVVLVTPVADDADGRALTGLLDAAGVRVVALPMTGSTVCKTRIRAGGQSMLRLDHGDGAAAGGDLPAEVAEILESARSICVADYGRGVTAHTGMREVLTRVAERTPVVWDPHPRGAAPTHGCWLVTPNQAEAERFSERGDSDAHSAERLRQRWRAGAVCVTLGAGGAVLATESGSMHVPVPAASGATTGRRDTCGAGDRFAIAATVALGAGDDVPAAVAAAVEAASRFVSTGGAVGVSSAAPVGGNHTGTGHSNALTGDLDEVRDRLRRRGGTLVATGGCFDLLHTGHIRLLHQARQLGDALVVLLNSDSSVRELKGPRRPVMAEQDRARVLAALACVDAVVIFDEHSPEQALERLRPDVWVKGGDYTENDLPEAGVVRRHGGEVVLLPTVAGYSSSNLIAAARS
ncbi:D-glycero-beta-D-manno-heptose 1-phosphate adenylyltransferase [Mycobacterium sp. CPCC 205372]|uniref:D-glycero-beta-D-manno-heptose 1-phosphate adenylyltransferase n=1 Tax=Mycobacterium hippophais TaxID=3016340 RepID=A0ABT4PRX2_9MYCO|nr:D-glycero-beta-D-manno-heptose 1-phosphate adenylyltransferase [Mycobacterium hippophais]MCZ8379239.1 D-glycero-beta-D-manno-heptose 1-phosphate adenylyltransferase [Mycobacterium hippophais]